MKEIQSKYLNYYRSFFNDLTTIIRNPKTYLNNFDSNINNSNQLLAIIIGVNALLSFVVLGFQPFVIINTVFRMLAFNTIIALISWLPLTKVLDKKSFLNHLRIFNYSSAALLLAWLSPFSFIFYLYFYYLSYNGLKLTYNDNHFKIITILLSAALMATFLVGILGMLLHF